MKLRGQSAGLLRLARPKTTVRWRLTLLYGGLFLVSGAALLAITYTLVDDATVTSNATFIQRAILGGAAQGGTQVKLRSPRTNFRVVHKPPPGQVPPPISRLLRSRNGRRAILLVGSQQRISDLHRLVVESSIALAIMALISGALGWLVAGRVLRPLRTMTDTTQQISEASLDRRLAMQGPHDELRMLADTIDGLLERLETAFDAQRRFVANASHELRTPLTAARALLEMVLSDPRATVNTFRTICAQVLEESEQQEQLIDALLALAQGQRGIEHREPVDLALIAGAVLQAHELDAAARGLDLDVSLEPALISGDRRLVERLVSNLLENALRHNVPHGRVRLAVQSVAGNAHLSVANTGPVVPADQVARLLQPFQRFTPDRTGHGDGLGLGLSIVAAIADAHNATLDVRAEPDGGLDIAVRFPRSPDVFLSDKPGVDSPRAELPPLPPSPVEVTRS